MALHGNRSVLLKSPGRFLNGGVAIMRSNFNRHGEQRSVYQVFSAKAATPDGHLSGSAWVLPKTAGGMSSRNFAVATFGAGGEGVGGITTTGVSEFAITTNTPDGQLISSGTGSASWAITTNNPLLTASIEGIGSTSFAITTNTPILGAEASASGSSVILFSCSATILPTNDTSPLRAASASFAITGSLLPYAVGSMSGSTVDNTVLTTDAIIAAMNASPPAVDIKRVNGYTVGGNGQTGTEWGPA